MESPVLVPMDVTEAERQMVEAIRKLHEPRDASRFYLEVKLDDGGGWEINMAVTIIDTGKTVAGRGVGATFDQAWDGMRPTEA
jgi:hypothetical protein